jgi:hypothetical protein
MCPGCLASVAMMVAGVMSTGGLTAVLMKKLGTHKGEKNSSQTQNPKEETWAK